MDDTTLLLLKAAADARQESSATGLKDEEGVLCGLDVTVERFYDAHGVGFMGWSLSSGNKSVYGILISLGKRETCRIGNESGREALCEV